METALNRWNWAVNLADDVIEDRSFMHFTVINLPRSMWPMTLLYHGRLVSFMYLIPRSLLWSEEPSSAVVISEKENYSGFCPYLAKWTFRSFHKMTITYLSTPSRQSCHTAWNGAFAYVLPTCTVFPRWEPMTKTEPLMLHFHYFPQTSPLVTNAMWHNSKQIM